MRSSTTLFHWIKIPSHACLHGNDVADQLANGGRLSSPLHRTSRCQPPAQLLGVAINTPTPPRRAGFAVGDQLATGSPQPASVSIKAATYFIHPAVISFPPGDLGLCLMKDIIVYLLNMGQWLSVFHMPKVYLTM